MDLRNPPPQLKVAPQRKKHYVRNFFVAFFALLLTTLAVNATDHIGNFRASILGSAIEGVLPASPFCEEGMTRVSSPEGDFCIDMYEVSASENCPHTRPQNTLETHDNIISSSCKGVSEEGKIPWTNVSHNQAIEICAQAGKHLPSNSQWFLASLGTPDKAERWDVRDCNVSGNWGSADAGLTGTAELCVSAAGAFDMIGNVWEWTFETVEQGVYKNTRLPQSGFVHGVSSEGLPTETQEEPSQLYYLDRFWLDATKTTGIFRGGYWGSFSDAGRYALHSEIPPSFSGNAVGFRCAK